MKVSFRESIGAENDFAMILWDQNFLLEDIYFKQLVDNISPKP